MRLLILHLATVFGGAERTTSNLIAALDRSIVEHLTIAAPAALRPYLPSGIDAFIDTAGAIKHGWFRSISTLLKDADSAASIVRRAAPDVVLGMMHYPAALAAIGCRRRRLPVKVVGSFRGPVYEHMRRYEQGPARRAFLSVAVGATARLADRMIVPSHGTADELSRRFLGARAHTVVIPNGVDFDAIERDATVQPAGLEHLRPDLPTLCVAARLSIEKDVGLLVAAFQQAQASQPMSLIVVGAGPQRAELERLVERAGLADRVAFVGHQDNVYPYMKQADLYVHTCQFEGFGYTMLEAMACGTPVIATDCPYGPREVIGENDYGVLVPMEDPSALAQGIVALLKDAERRRRLAAAGVARARELSLDRMARSYEAVFRDLQGA